MSGRRPPQATSGTDTRAALLERWRRGDLPVDDIAPIPPRAYASDVAPLGLAQQRLWFLEQLRPGTPAFNLCFVARVDGALQPDLLAAAVDELVDRHAVLRTTFATVDGAPTQVIDRGRRPTSTSWDLRDDADGGAAAGAWVDDAIHRPFDLHDGPLVRFLHAALPDGDLLCVVAHHLVADGWSLGVALRELSQLYETRRDGHDHALEGLPIQYADVAVWQRANVREDDWAGDLAYWRTQLAGAPPLSLPTDRTRPPVQTTAGDFCELQVPRALSDRIRQLARQHDATLYMVVLAAVQALLRRLTGQHDVVVGGAVANRPRTETRRLIGNFINMVALRTVLDGDPGFRDLLAAVRGTCTAAVAHQEVPFERVVEELAPERDPSRHVLFQVSVVQQPPTTALTFAGRRLRMVRKGVRAVRADLELDLWDHPEVTGRIAYSTDLFERATVLRLRERLLAVLAAVADDVDVRVSDLPVVLPEEHALLDAWGTGAVTTPSETPVHERFARHVAARPDADAVRSRGATMTAAELDAAARRLARRLVALGVGPEVRVGICSDRCVDLVVAVLGVLHAGGAYVPLDPRYPPDRLAFMVADARARVVVTQRNLVGRIGGDDVTTVLIDDLPPGEPDGVALPDATDPGQLAYVIYTSGSTGLPKGVQITHRSLCNLTDALIDALTLHAGDVVASVASLSFDASVAEWFPTLAAGATLLVATEDEVTDGARLRELIMTAGVTVLQATSTSWQALLDVGGLAGTGVTALCGGEPTPEPVGDTLARSHDDAWHMYGPTEACVWASMQRMEPGGGLALGRPLPNTTLHVVDERLRRVPVGVVGELAIGGTGVARGYLGRPALTADRFVPDPFTDRRGARLYRTGDLVRFGPDGALHFVGRSDHQIKLRGHRIELGEIESRLASHPDVEGAAVTVRRTGHDAQLVGYVRPRDGVSDDERARLGPVLSRLLRDRLPSYMVPSQFVVVDAFPTTPTGKIDRAALPAPDRDRPELHVAYVAPRSERERAIAAITADFLDIDRVGLHDDFFELGGHSLLAARLIRELRDRYGVELLLQELFVTPTVEHLAAEVEREIARSERFASEDVRLRRALDDVPDETVTALLRGLANETT